MINEVTENEISLSSFKIKSELNPRFFPNGKLNSRVRLRLMDIADDFIKELAVDWVKPKDMILTGSIANYNWSRYSDVDVHIVYDFKKVYPKNSDFVDDYFKAKRENWLSNHENLKIFGFPIEISIEDSNEDNPSSGRYSLYKNKWIVEPNDFQDAIINQDFVKKKSAYFMTQIDDIERKMKDEKDSHKCEKYGNKVYRIFDKLRKMRTDGLASKKKEMSSGNIIYKIIRRAGYLDKIWDIYNKSYDRSNSIESSKKKLDEMYEASTSANHTDTEYYNFRAYHSVRRDCINDVFYDGFLDPKAEHKGECKQNIIWFTTKEDNYETGFRFSFDIDSNTFDEMDFRWMNDIHLVTPCKINIMDKRLRIDKINGVLIDNIFQRFGNDCDEFMERCFQLTDDDLSNECFIDKLLQQYGFSRSDWYGEEDDEETENIYESQNRGEKFSAGIIPFRLNKDGKTEVFLGFPGKPKKKGFEPPMWMNRWQIMKGHMEFGENPKECAIREFCEESGVSPNNINSNELISLGKEKMTDGRNLVCYGIDMTDNRQFDRTNFHSNMVDSIYYIELNGGKPYPEIEKYGWKEIDKVGASAPYETAFYSKCNEICQSRYSEPKEKRTVIISDEQKEAIRESFAN